MAQVWRSEDYVRKSSLLTTWVWDIELRLLALLRSSCPLSNLPSLMLTLQTWWCGSQRHSHKSGMREKEMIKLLTVHNSPESNRVKSKAHMHFGQRPSSFIPQTDSQVCLRRHTQGCGWHKELKSLYIVRHLHKHVHQRTLLETCATDVAFNTGEAIEVHSRCLIQVPL